MGGLGGGWITAFLLIPHTSLRLSLVATGIVLLMLAVAWAALGSSGSTPVILVLLAGAIGVFAFHRPERTFKDKRGATLNIRYSRQSGIGLLQVLDSATSRTLLINGVVNGQMDLDSKRSVFDYIRHQHLIAHSHHDSAKTALVLGLGAGMLPKELVADGVKVTAVEIEPRMVEIAREFFDLPPAVDVILADGRAHLRHDRNTYDLIFLDTFASETAPWHMLTAEAFAEMKRRLNPAGRLLINTVGFAGGEDRPGRAGMRRIEASVRSVFDEAIVYPDQPTTSDPDELINVTIVAGEKLNAQLRLPKSEPSMQALAKLLVRGRPASADRVIATDDRSDLDYLEASMRIRWRSLIWDSVYSTLLWD
jgi:spermidine synthase